jgi:hypothetical protein
MSVGHFCSLANAGSGNVKVVYELPAHNPIRNPVTMAWGSQKADNNGRLRFNGKLDSSTWAWIRNYGLNGAISTVIPS